MCPCKAKAIKLKQSWVARKEKFGRTGISPTAKVNVTAQRVLKKLQTNK